MNKEPASHQALAAAITKAASKQTYYTIRLLADRDRVADAYLAYSYFRWLDDQLDQGELHRSERIALITRQKTLMECCLRGVWPQDLTSEEGMLVDLVRENPEKNRPLQAYLRNMMAVMAFDAGRKGRLISQEELGEYSRLLATAVTEAMHYFIGHSCFSPHSEARYLAVTAAHITHMLRDTVEDAAAGYFNIPREFIELHGISPLDVSSQPYRTWVWGRVRLARDCFRAGKDYLAQVENPRCRIAGYAYIARFEGVLDAIEREGFLLRSAYPEHKSLAASLRMGWSVLSLALNRQNGSAFPALPVR